MSGHQVSKQALAKPLAVVLVVSVLILNSTNHLTTARYLPTRADDSDVEVLKDLLRELISQSNMDQMIESRLNRLQATNPIASERYIIPTMHVSGQRTHQVERQSELPQPSVGDSITRIVGG